MHDVLTVFCGLRFEGILQIQTLLYIYIFCIVIVMTFFDRKLCVYL